MTAAKFTVEQVIAAIEQTKGFVTLAAQKLGCEPQTVRNYVKRYAAVRTALAEERERMTDIAELALYNKIQAGEGWAVSLYLKTIGRSRGYVEKHEVEVSLRNAAEKLAGELGISPAELIAEAERIVAHSER